MPQFRYRAIDKFGRKTEGVLDAKSADEIALHLNNAGYKPLSIKEIRFEAITKRLQNLFKIKHESFILFNRQLATLIDVGLPLLSALDTLFNQTRDYKLKNVINLVRKDIEEGTSFSESLFKHPRVFNELYISMVRSAETAGILPEVLNQLAALEEYQYEISAKLKTATRYPIFIMAAMGIAISIVTVFVLPRFAGVFSSFGAQLPLPTRILIKVSYLAKHYWYGILLFIIFLIYAGKLFSRTGKGSLLLDKYKLKIPVIGPLILIMSMSRCCRILAAMIKSGVPILEALQVVGKTLGNQVLIDVFNKVSIAVERGEPVSKAMTVSTQIPLMIVDVTAIGEKTGQLDNLLFKVSNYYDTQIDYRIKNLLTMLEPVLLLFIGSMVLFLALAIFLPMWNMVYVVR